MSKLYGLALLAVVAVFVGCNPSGQTDEAKKANAQRPVGVGTINVGEILKTLGLATQLEQRHALLQQRLANAFNKNKADYEARNKEYGDHPTEDQKKALAKFLGECQANVNREQENDNKNWNELVGIAQGVLKKKVDDPIRQIAEERGLAVIIQIPNNAMAYTADASDITLDVITKIGNNMQGTQNVFPPIEPETPTGLIPPGNLNSSFTPGTSNVPTNPPGPGSLQSPGLGPAPGTSPAPGGAPGIAPGPGSVTPPPGDHPLLPDGSKGPR